MNFDVLSDDFVQETSIFSLKVSSVWIAFFAMLFAIASAIFYYLAPYTILFSVVSIVAASVVIISNYIALSKIFDDMLSYAF